jgi:hypothetical protein
MFIQEKSLKIFPRITKPENFRFIWKFFDIVQN